jgi:inner membrane protein
MMVKGHLLVGTAGFLLYKGYQQPEGIECSLRLLYEYLVIMIGVLLPDVDHPKSTVGSRVKFIAYPIYYIFGHRGFTHGLLFWAIMYGLTIHYSIELLSYLCIGAMLHLVGDYLTPSGIPLFAPLSKRTYRAPLVADTNSMSEHIFSFGSLSLAIWYVFFY